MTLKETIEQQVVNDYFTPNIKAEVILDTLLTPYLAACTLTKKKMRDAVAYAAIPLERKRDIFL